MYVTLTLVAHGHGKCNPTFTLCPTARITLLSLFADFKTGVSKRKLPLVDKLWNINTQNQVEGCFSCLSFNFYSVCVWSFSLFFLSCISIFIMLWSPIYSLSPLCTCPEYLSFTSNFFPKCSISADPLMYSFLILLIHKYTKEVEGKIHAI